MADIFIKRDARDLVLVLEGLTDSWEVKSPAIRSCKLKKLPVQALRVLPSGPYPVLCVLRQRSLARMIQKHLPPGGWKGPAQGTGGESPLTEQPQTKSGPLITLTAAPPPRSITVPLNTSQPSLSPPNSHIWWLPQGGSRDPNCTPTGPGAASNLKGRKRPGPTTGSEQKLLEPDGL